METIIKGLKIDSFSDNSGGTGGLDYSTSEQDTGRKWIDGETVYCKSFLLTQQQLDQFNSTGSVELSLTTGKMGICLNSFFYGRVVSNMVAQEFISNPQDTSMWNENLTKQFREYGGSSASIRLHKGSRYSGSNFNLIYGYVEYTKYNIQ